MASEKQEYMPTMPSPAYPSAPPPYQMHPGGPPQGAPPYAAPGFLPGGYYPPPPPYPGESPQGYPQAYSQGYPPPSQPQPQQMGTSQLYPDVSQLPQPQAVPLGFSCVPSHPHGSNPSMPQRPAPPPPQGYQTPLTQQGDNESLALSHLKEGETPGRCVVSWRGGEGVQVFFMQQEGHVVSPSKKPLMLSVYKKINGNHGKSGAVEEGMVGMIEVHGCWRLRLLGHKTYVLRTTGDVYVFRDDSTCPGKSARVVVVVLPDTVSRTMRADLSALLRELTDMREEEEGAVDKITTGVSTVYSDITKKLNITVKDTVPGAHKSTKWLRKGTGNLVRMGGNLVSKGMHFVADQLPAGEQHHQEESPAHTELLEALKKYKKHVEEGSITHV